MLVELSARYISGAPHHPAQWTPTVRKGGRSHALGCSRAQPRCWLGCPPSFQLLVVVRPLQTSLGCGNSTTRRLVLGRALCRPEVTAMSAQVSMHFPRHVQYVKETSMLTS
jgi:hypothetical protein